MRQKKLINLYNEWMETGKLIDRPGSPGCGGLCNALPLKYHPHLEQFEPDDYSIFWAYPLTLEQQRKMDSKTMRERFTPLRQTIVLFICAMNNEL